MHKFHPYQTAAANNVTQASQTALKLDHCATSSDKQVIVSLSQQHMWVCNGKDEVYQPAVTSGATKLGDATPTGTWQIYAKQTNRYLTGSDSRGSWNDYVNYWMPFYGDYGFHDASWQTFLFGDLQKYPIQGSHGCVHLPMAWLYNWAQVGTTVSVQS